MTGTAMRGAAMRAAALAGLLALPGCSGFPHFLGDTSGITLNRNQPLGNGETMRRARGDAIEVKPLLTQPGDVWPGPYKPEPSLADLQRMQDAQAPQGPGGDGQASAPPALPPALRRGTGSGAGQAPPGAAPAKGESIVIPNGNGTSTVIEPDGGVRTIPTPH